MAQQDVIDFLEENGGKCTFKQLKENVDLSNRALHNNVEALLKRGRVTKIPPSSVGEVTELSLETRSDEESLLTW